MRASLVAGLAALLVSGGCGRNTPLEPARTVVLRFENLTGDANYAWTAAGGSHALAAQLAGGARYLAVDAGGGGPAQRAEAIAAGFTRIVHGRLTLVSGRLWVRVDIEDARTRKMERSAQSSGAPEAGLLPLVDAVARALDGGAATYGTRQDAALRALAEGRAEEAATVDPGFAEAWLTAARAAANGGRRADAERLLAEAKKHAATFTAADRARLEADVAELSGDAPGRAVALARLAEGNPADANAMRVAADAAFAARDFARSVELFRKAARLAPGAVEVWNLLGYAQAYAGDLAGAAASLREYGKLRPGDPNPLDSLGEVHLLLGRTAEAEAYFRQAWQANPRFLDGAPAAKAALCRLYAGDLRGATSGFSEYVEGLRKAGNPFAEFRQAQVEFLTGRAAEAAARMAALMKKAEITGERDLASIAGSQLAAWRLGEGRRAEASAIGQRAMSLATGGAARVHAAVVVFAAQPETTAAALTTRADRMFAAPEVAGLRRWAAAWALLLQRHYAAALPVLRDLEAATRPAPSDATPVLLAWALRGTGAAPALDRNYVESFTDANPFGTVAVRKLIELREARR